MRNSFHTQQDNVWFTADLHFGHEAMLRPDVCGRPWTNVDEMDQALVNNWNSVVGEDDHIFILGDLSFRSHAETVDILAHLQGKKYLILGNHDRRLKSAALAMFEDVEHYHEIRVDDQRIVLCHFAFRTWNCMHHGAWNLHGHSHGTLKPMGRQMDVSVDAVGHTRFPGSYGPVNFFAIDLKTAPIEVVDHHVPKSGVQD